MKVLIDGMGGDNAPFEIVKGVCEASKIVDSQICIIGDKILIEKELRKHDYDRDKVSVFHASEVISNDESPVRAVVKKKDSSVVRGMELLAKEEGDVFISAGSTGALLVSSIKKLEKISGVDRPVLASTYPVLTKRPSLLVDAGSSPECKPRNLLEYAIMGSIYAEKVIGVQRPKVGLVNVGTEKAKGTSDTKKAYELIENTELNFIGNVEARDIPRGICDVIVCNGFVGNVILKLTEGLAWNIFSIIKRKFLEGAKAKVGALFLKSKLTELKSEVDYSKYGGAPILGVKGAVIKIHGSSKSESVRNGIIKGIEYAQKNVIDIISKELNK